MAELRILYFSHSLLERDEIFPGDDLVEAVRHASSRAAHLRVEIWSGAKKVAVVRPSALAHPYDEIIRPRMV
jgi:hypothetical protein